MSDLNGRCVVTKTHAGRADHANALRKLRLKRLEHPLCPKQGTGQAVADSYREWRDVRSALLHHVEVSVERGCFEDLGERQAHFLRQRSQMRCGDLPISVLDAMQVLDQEIALARGVRQQRLDGVGGVRIDLTALRNRAGPDPTPAGVLESANLGDVFGAIVLAHRGLLIA